jgi:UDPglucose 6-dehydrogenase
MNVAVIGTGYVGLVTGTCFAEMGNSVICVDIDKSKIAKMRDGQIPIYEPDLGNIFKRNIQEGCLHFTTDIKQGVAKADVIFLALPTPPTEDGSADLRYVINVATDLGKILDHYTVIVDKSTVPVGTAEKVREHIAKNAKTDFDVASNPEFLREGFAVADFMNPDRVVIGTTSKRARSVLVELYDPFVRQGSSIIFMDERSAEMTKYAANSFLATKISFMNEIANLCEKAGADVDAVRQGIGSDERIGRRFLFPGIGYGGSCFPKDVMALHKTAQDYDYTFHILEAVTRVNTNQKQRLVQKVMNYYNGDIAGKTFALWGLAFKPDTDDIREAPALEMIKALTTAGAKVIAYDPEAMDNVKRLSDHPQLDFAKDKYTVLKDADALLIATEWSDFKAPDFDKMKKLLKTPIIFDGRNLYEPELLKKHGFYYESIGRRVVNVK